jgi:hypothetical protein
MEDQTFGGQNLLYIFRQKLEFGFDWLWALVFIYCLFVKEGQTDLKLAETVPCIVHYI